MTNIWRHRKTGGAYAVIQDNVMIEATMTPGTLYMSLETGQKWIRPESEFYDGRFERLESLPAGKES